MFYPTQKHENHSTVIFTQALNVFPYRKVIMGHKMLFVLKCDN